ASDTTRAFPILESEVCSSRPNVTVHFDSSITLSRSRNGSTATEFLANSFSRILFSSFQFWICREARTPAKRRQIARLPARMGLRRDHRYKRAGGEIGRAVIGRPASHRSKSWARSTEDP